MLSNLVRLCFFSVKRNLNITYLGCPHAARADIMDHPSLIEQGLRELPSSHRSVPIYRICDGTNLYK